MSYNITEDRAFRKQEQKRTKAGKTAAGKEAELMESEGLKMNTWAEFGVKALTLKLLLASVGPLMRLAIKKHLLTVKHSISSFITRDKNRFNEAGSISAIEPLQL